MGWKNITNIEQRFWKFLRPQNVEKVSPTYLSNYNSAGEWIFEKKNLVLPSYLSVWSHVNSAWLIDIKDQSPPSYGRWSLLQTNRVVLWRSYFQAERPTREKCKTLGHGWRLLTGGALKAWCFPIIDNDFLSPKIKSRLLASQNCVYYVF